MRFMEEMDEYGLMDHEIVQILNLRPTSMALLYAVVESIEVRLTSTQITSLLDICRQLPDRLPTVSLHDRLRSAKKLVLTAVPKRRMPPPRPPSEEPDPTELQHDGPRQNEEAPKQGHGSHAPDKWHRCVCPDRKPDGTGHQICTCDCRREGHRDAPQHSGPESSRRGVPLWRPPDVANGLPPAAESRLRNEEPPRGLAPRRPGAAEESGGADDSSDEEPGSTRITRSMARSLAMPPLCHDREAMPEAPDHPEASGSGMEDAIPLQFRAAWHAAKKPQMTVLPYKSYVERWGLWRDGSWFIVGRGTDCSSSSAWCQVPLLRRPNTPSAALCGVLLGDHVLHNPRRTTGVPLNSLGPRTFETPGMWARHREAGRPFPSPPPPPEQRHRGGGGPDGPLHR